MIWPGETDAWEELISLDRSEICGKSYATYDTSSSTYTLNCFNQKIHISLDTCRLYSSTDTGHYLLETVGRYARLSILHYLIHATHAPLSGTLIKPDELPGGKIFSQGTHVLPLDSLIEYYVDHPDMFFAAGRELGATQLNFGDISISLHPLPKVKVVIIIWQGDDEFSPRASLLFDKSCTAHLPTDIIWSTAMMTVGMIQSFSPIAVGHD